MAKKCVPSNPIIRDASVEATKIALSIEASYTREFGMPMNLSPGLKINLKNLKRDLGLAAGGGERCVRGEAGTGS